MPLPQATQAQLDNFFTYHPPDPNTDAAERYTRIRAAAKVFAEELAALCPPGADLTCAIRHVRDAVFTANASFACAGPGDIFPAFNPPAV